MRYYKEGGEELEGHGFPMSLGTGVFGNNDQFHGSVSKLPVLLQVGHFLNCGFPWF